MADAEFKDFLSKFAPAVGALAADARAMIQRELPQLAEHFDRGHWVIRYGSGAKMGDMIVYITAHKDSINLGFAHGAHLPDPSGLMRGTGKNMRHVKFKPGDAVDTPPVRALLAAALAHASKA